MNTQLLEKISFYIVAHADDWQLFMQPLAYKDILSKNKVVFIITTAGDAGMAESYWRAREEGLKSSIRFCIASFTACNESSGIIKLNEHSINYWSVNNIKCYFLRLPDGNLNGSGYEKHAHQSLPKFKSSGINFITAVDDTTSYKNWFDLCNTLQAIIQHESSNNSTVWINYLNPDPNLNPNDHADHKATGEAIQAIPLISNFNQALFVGYNSTNNTDILDPVHLFWKAGMFATYEKCVFDTTGYSTLKENIETYITWCSKKAKFITVPRDADFYKE
jgi:hypothetical protein